MVAAMATGCGGGGNSGSSAPPITVTPPTGGTGGQPTPPAQTAVTFSVVALGAMPGSVVIDSNNDLVFGSGDAVTSTSLAGEFGQGIAVARPSIALGIVPATAANALQALGVDRTSGFVFALMRAPAGATVVSPLSSLVAAHGNVAAVRGALGLASGSGAIAATIDPLHFNPATGLASSDPAIARDAARLTAINLRLLAVAAFTKKTNGDPVEMTVGLDDGSKALAELIAGGATIDLADKALVLQLLRKTPYASAAPEQLDAMAGVLARYFAAVPERIGDEASARAWMLAFRFGAFAEMRILAAQWPNPAATRIAALGAADFAALAERFRTAPAPQVGELTAVPDYLELGPDSVVPYSVTLSTCTNQPRLPVCNDYTLALGTASDNQLVVATPGEPDKVELFRPEGGPLTVRRRFGSSFTGLTWFDYTARNTAGATASGRVWVRVRDGA